MQYNISHLYPKYDIYIEGASYIGAPRDHTVMYVSKKVEYLLENLTNHKDCLVYAENGIEVPKDLIENNCFIFTTNPQLEYAKFANVFVAEKQKQEAERTYVLQQEGYWLGENVTLGENVYIEPQCVIGHDVIIGNNARILSGSIIKNAVIGDDFLCNEKAIIGSASFTMTEDKEGNNFRIPTLGGVLIGNYVEVGAFDNICAGASGNTRLEDFVKLDALVHIGHEAYLGKNSKVTAGVIIGGFAVLEEKAYTGINSCIKNRITVGSHSIIGMGATVIKSVQENNVVGGNPARTLYVN